jgi:hypothetical protein
MNNELLQYYYKANSIREKQLREFYISLKITSYKTKLRFEKYDYEIKCKFVKDEI